MLTLLASLALAATPTHPVTLDGGLFQTVATDSYGAGVYGRATAHLSDHWSIDAGLREGYLARVQGTLGAVTAGVRYTPGRGPSVRMGFLHHHETPWALAKRFPVQTALGSLSGISHRSGLELGIGADIPMLQRGYEGRLGGTLELSVGAFPDPAGASVFVFLQQGFSVDVGKRRRQTPLDEA